MRSKLKRHITVTLLLLPWAASIQAQDSVQVRALLSNPSTWINESYTRLNDLYLFYNTLDLDTMLLNKEFADDEVSIKILKDEFYKNNNSLNIRTLYNMKMRVADILTDINKWHIRVHKINEILVRKTGEAELIRSEINEFSTKADSIYRSNFEAAVNRLSLYQHEGEKNILTALKKNTELENRIVDTYLGVYLFNSDITSLLQKRESDLIKRELPPIWRSSPATYPYSIRDVLVASFNQTLDSLKYYAEISIWKIIIFRFLVFLLCLIPIAIFNNEMRKKHLLAGVNLVFLAKFPKTASVVMGMAIAPLIFSHPPHAFLEMIFIGLTVTVTQLTLKNYPRINAPLLILIIAAFLVLYLINFFVTPTFIGRLFYGSSILLIWPVYKIFMQLPQYQLRHEKIVKAFIIFIVIHLVTGWVFVLIGTYTLGRSIILAAYSLLVISLILRIAIFTFLDYMLIMIYFFNSGVRTVKINADYVYNKTKPLLILSATVFILIAYLFSMNLFDLVKSGIISFMVTPRHVGITEFTLLSITLFFAAVYLAFVLASMIRHTFEPQHDRTVEKRSRLGSYLLLFRLMILCAGFAVGIMISGIPLTNFTIFLGALGVGIGFGLQNIVSNLVSGLIIAFERPFVVGDLLDFENGPCRVKEISLRATMVHTSDGADILIPNSTLMSENLKNWTVNGSQRFIELKVMAVHASDPAEVTAIINTCLDLQEGIDRGRCTVLLTEISEMGFVFTIKILIHNLEKGLAIRSQVLSAIRSAFAVNNILFPQKNFRFVD
jgi:potassium-dependent mechanosensitive channel